MKELKKFRKFLAEGQINENPFVDSEGQIDENIEEGFFGDLKQNIAMKIAQMSFNSASKADKVRTLFSILNDFEKKHPEIKNNPDFDALKKDVITSRITSVLEFVERVKALKGGE